MATEIISEEMYTLIGNLDMFPQRNIMAINDDLVKQAVEAGYLRHVGTSFYSSNRQHLMSKFALTEAATQAMDAYEALNKAPIDTPTPAEAAPVVTVHPVVEYLRKLDVETLSPMDALTALYRLKQMVAS